MPLAAIGAVASIGGALISSSSQKKAANKAAQAATDNTAANNALARDIYGQNKATLAPFVNTGTNASGAINALLGLGGPANSNQPAVGGAPVYGATNGFTPGDSWTGYNPQKGPNYGQDMIRGEVSAIGGGQTQNATPNAIGTSAAAPNAQQQYENAFANYRNSTGYNFRVNEGQDAINTGYAAGGTLRSGAALKSLENYRQGVASNEFGNYLNALMAQQGVGLSAAGAQAGVSTNFVNQTTANNNSAADAAANAAIAKGKANANMWGGIANGVGSLFGSSFF